ncbi:helix-turn-helix domain-containing protein [Streptomyces roseirectus]|uniref:Helix-turn-helix domain-containing protein n=1 Tax=Streptomyces roseirectus TaxID=2768066 RepID=A0A7H0ID07_9ACTN|nr:helix-turn-helix domain-containing protein [Streptomyces roseirectus]QNP70673.1 helix-turn-helix domain-containing protein [Streptomyces roseirectus]
MTQSQATPLPPPKERRRLRVAHALTQAQIASTVGVTRETVRAWETGRTTPRGTKREAYARLLASLEGEVTGVRGVTEPQTAGAQVFVTDIQGPTAQPPVPVAASSQSAPFKEPGRPQEPAPPQEPGERPPLTPAQAFDALYAFCAPALVRQTYLLTGRRELARESVERAFQSAWQRWPEVATDRDPAGWVRATAYEYALSPWHRLRPRYRHPEPPPASAPDRALLDVLLRLPPSYRRTLVLYDGVGLDLPETAAETEASTPAAANRVLHAREALAIRLPELSDPATLHRRLAEVASAERLRAPRPAAVRLTGERRASFWTRAAIAFTVAIIGATALTLNTAPTHYEPPVPPGATVSGVPPRQAPGALSDAELALRAKLRRETAHGPERLVPESK